VHSRMGVRQRGCARGREKENPRGSRTRKMNGRSRLITPGSGRESEWQKGRESERDEES